MCRVPYDVSLLHFSSVGGSEVLNWWLESHHPAAGLHWHIDRYPRGCGLLVTSLVIQEVFTEATCPTMTDMGSVVENKHSHNWIAWKSFLFWLWVQWRGVFLLFDITHSSVEALQLLLYGSLLFLYDIDLVFIFVLYVGSTVYIGFLYWSQCGCRLQHCGHSGISVAHTSLRLLGILPY